MKSVIYVTGISGALLLVLAFITYMVQQPIAYMFFYFAMLMLLGGFLPLFIINKRKSSKHPNRITQKHAAMHHR